MRTAALALATCLLVLPVLPQGGFLPRDGPTSDRPTPPIFVAGPAPPEAPLIVEVYYRSLRDDEYIAIGNPRSADADVGGWTLTDLEGTLRFPDGTVVPPGGRITVAQNATAYREDTLRVADFAYGSGEPPAFATGSLRLANDGDEILLRDASGATVDAFAWGDSRYRGPGWSGPPAAVVLPGHRAVRSGEAAAWRDTDAAADWDSPRVYALGQEDRPLASFAADRVTAFLSPDAALPALASRLRAARASAYVAVYELTSGALAAELLAAARRGVDVGVLLEGSPVGGLDAASWSIAQNLSAAGARVRFLSGDPRGDIVARYPFLHAKYAVLDGATAIVGSENWGDHGFPAPPASGNRGWHVAVESPDLAAELSATFLSDFDPARRDSVDLADFRGTPVPSRPNPAPGSFASARGPVDARGPIRVTAVLGPDHTLREDGALGALRSATASIAAEVLLADRAWGRGPNPYLEALVDAARRGVRVRVLLDGTEFSDAGAASGNREAAAFLNSAARAAYLPMEARVFPAGAGGLRLIHAKGFVVDGRVAFVSSLNWNLYSATRNREVGVLLESAAVATYFADAFERDWSLAGGGADVPLQDLAVPVLALGAASAGLAVFRRRRRRRKEL